MSDLTTGPLTRHLLKTTSFMLVTMVFQTLYFLVDLYWVGRLGTEAVAAVGIAGNVNFLVLALTQMLGVGTTTLVAHAAGRKDHARTHRVFTQSQLFAMVTGLAFLGAGLAARTAYADAMSADARTAALAAEYLLWFVPALALQFAIVAMGAALRGTGQFRPGMIVGTASVVLNLVLAPVFIFGWGTGRPLGVAGAAISTLVALAIAVVWLTAYFVGPKALLHFDAADWRPRLDVWRQMLVIGLPAGVEFALMALYLAVVYALSRPFGAAAQAGFGIGQRITQAGFMPVVALGFAVAPVAGQNFGARRADRVKGTFRDAAVMAVAAMALFALVCQLAPHALIGLFTADPAAVAVGEEYLRIISWGYVGSGLIFVASSMFQAMGNTVPSLVASVVRIVLVTVPAFALARLPGFRLDWVWLLALGGTAVQLALAMLFLRREFARRLDFGVAVPEGARLGAPAAVSAPTDA